MKFRASARRRPLSCPGVLPEDNFCIAMTRSEGRMMEDFFVAALVIITLPYGLIFLALLWNEIGPPIRTRRARGAVTEDLTSPK